MHTILDLQEALAGISDVLAMGAQVGTIAAALLQCFFGFRMVRFWVTAAGFFLGAYAGFHYLSPLVLSEDRAWYLPLLIALATGIALSIVSFKIFRVGLFLFTGSVAAYAAITAIDGLRVLPEGSLQPILRGALLVGVFLLTGWLAVRFFRTAVIAVTAIGGAWTAVHTLSGILPSWFPEAQSVWIAFAAVAVFGILVQFLTTRKE